MQLPSDTYDPRYCASCWHALMPDCQRPVLAGGCYARSTCNWRVYLFYATWCIHYTTRTASWKWTLKMIPISLLDPTPSITTYTNKQQQINCYSVVVVVWWIEIDTYIHICIHCRGLPGFDEDWCREWLLVSCWEHCRRGDRLIIIIHKDYWFKLYRLTCSYRMGLRYIWMW